MRTSPSWSEFERLVADQKLEQAFAVADEIRREATPDPAREAEVTEALIQQTMLRVALHGDATAVRFLVEQPWPRTFLQRTILELFLGQVRMMHLRSYAWEIRKRPTIAGDAADDLDQMSAEQIVASVLASHRRIWSSRSELSDAPVSCLGEHAAQGDYPAYVRGTLRDFLSYQIVSVLADTTHWPPEASSQIYEIDRGALLHAPNTNDSPSVDDDAVHPLVRLCAVLDDLERWHATQGRQDAALEASVEKARRLHAALEEPDDREAVKSHLGSRLAAHGKRGWWSVGQAELARLHRGDGDRVTAHALAAEGAGARGTDERGRTLCAALAKRIREPDVHIRVRTHDGPQRRSIQVQYKNLKRLHFRAFAYDLKTQVLGARDYHLLPGYPDWQRIWRQSQARQERPVAAWSVDLPETSDFDRHQAFVTPPLSAPGLYVILASVREDFADAEGNRLSAASFVVSDLVLLTNPAPGGLEAVVLSGEAGAPVPGARVSLARLDHYAKRHEEVKSATTDGSGQVRFSVPEHRSYGLFLLAEKDGQATLQTEVVTQQKKQSFHKREVLLYTDRSVYRPDQSLHFKALVFAGDARQGTFDPGTGEPLEVSLVDANGQIVETKKLTTNSFGSASGSFVVPSGRLLGRWRLETKSHQSVFVQVEEYKRPSFEVTLSPGTEALRLNAPAEIEGQARYYFGAPVAGGKVVWRVERAPRLPPWWMWAGIDTRPTRVASGVTKVAQDGSLHIRFTPKADPRKASVPGISFVYDVQVEVTDEGGETRRARRRVRLGYTSIESSIEIERAFALASTPLGLKIERRDLDGNPRAGQGRWRLTRVAQPAGPVPGPADLPLDTPEAEGLRLPDDDKRTRWDSTYRPDRVMASWPDGELVGQGQTVHGPEGRASLTLPPLQPGPYRIHYETDDDQGRRHSASKTFLSVAASTPVALPAVFEVSESCVAVGRQVQIFVASGTLDQVIFLDVYRAGERVQRRVFRPGDPELLTWEIDASMRGGIAMTMFAVRDFQLIAIRRSVFVPWDDKELSLELSTFRDRLRPGTRERWSLVVRGPDGRAVGERAAEVLAYMYDRSLEVFAPHRPTHVLDRYPSHTSSPLPAGQQGATDFARILHDRLLEAIPEPWYRASAFMIVGRYGVGGPGARGFALRTQAGVMPPGAIPPPPAMAPMPAAQPSPAAPAPAPQQAMAKRASSDEAASGSPPGDDAPPAELRSNFAESAFFLPHLTTDGQGAVAVEFDVPDAVTEWAVWIHAVTRELRSAVLRREVKTTKELVVRPYLPRFLREGDEATLRVMVTNTSNGPVDGTVHLAITDPTTDECLDASFGIETTERRFEVDAASSTTVGFEVRVPRTPGSVAFRVQARTQSMSDGELRALPVLPSRVHLAQSRFVTLRGQERKIMRFEDLARGNDESLQHDALVVRLDAQLFYSVLKALPYLVEYPYACCEQMLNRFVSASIVASVYETFPSVAAMARNLPRRDSRFERWDGEDPNRRMQVEETPWLREARGGGELDFPLLDMLDRDVVARVKDASLAELGKAQTRLGGFPWFPGGPPSPFITLYVLEGLARAAEFGVRVPESTVREAWGYLTRHFRTDIFPRLREGKLPPPAVTFLLHTLHAYRDASLTAGAFTPQEREELLAYAWRAWRDHPPMLKLQLALTLHRVGRTDDASKVLDAVMDSAKTDPGRGTHWAAEARSWLWYNDTTETHAFALRVLGELRPDDPRRDGLVLWLLLDKKLNQWKSTKATAAAIYALVHHMSREGTLGVAERAVVTVGSRTKAFDFQPDRWAGNATLTLEPETVDATCAEVVVDKQSPGWMFASATWHFSTERVPEASGDLFSLERRLFKRETAEGKTTLRPLSGDTAIAVGDEIEVHLSIRCGHAAEYVHVRDPRPAGSEPDKLRSGWRSDLGLLCYEEVRDSGTSFFFEGLPKGEYTLRHRVRATTAGRFRTHPATIQSMYAPELCAYSSGAEVVIREPGKS